MKEQKLKEIENEIEENKDLIYKINNYSLAMLTKEDKRRLVALLIGDNIELVQEKTRLR